MSLTLNGFGRPLNFSQNAEKAKTKDNNPEVSGEIKADKNGRPETPAIEYEAEAPKGPEARTGTVIKPKPGEEIICNPNYWKNLVTPRNCLKNIKKNQEEEAQLHNTANNINTSYKANDAE